MKILQINKYFYRRAGAEAVYLNTIELLRRHGHEVVPFSIKHPKNDDTEYSGYFADAPEIRDMGVLDKIKSVPRFFYSKDAAAKLERLIEKERPDVAHIHNIFNGLSLSVLDVLKRHDIPVVATLHDTRYVCATTNFMKYGKTCENCQKTAYINCLLRRCFEGSVPHSLFIMLEMIHKDFFFDYNKCIDEYIFLNEWYLGQHAKRHSYFRDKSNILYNFYPDQIGGEPKRGDYFLYYGRIVGSKGVETLLNAAKHLPDMRFKFAGTGPMLDYLKAQNVPNVEFTGFLKGQELHDIIRNASFIVVPSEGEENNPLTIIESNSMGKPVIGSDKKGILEIMRQGKTGIVFPEGNLEGLIGALKLADSFTDKQYELMSQSALEFAKENFDSERHYERLMEIYANAIRKHSK